jgi:hypothetical protein
VRTLLPDVGFIETVEVQGLQYGAFMDGDEWRSDKPIRRKMPLVMLAHLKARRAIKGCVA